MDPALPSPLCDKEHEDVFGVEQSCVTSPPFEDLDREVEAVMRAAMPHNANIRQNTEYSESAPSATGGIHIRE